MKFGRAVQVWASSCLELLSLAHSGPSLDLASAALEALRGHVQSSADEAWLKHAPISVPISERPTDLASSVGMELIRTLGKYHGEVLESLDDHYRHIDHIDT